MPLLRFSMVNLNALYAFPLFRYFQDPARLTAQQLPCLHSAIASSGCGPNDYICQCISSREKIQVLAKPCLISACNASEVAVANSVGLSLCSGFSTSLAAGMSTRKPDAPYSQTPLKPPSCKTITSFTPNFSKLTHISLPSCLNPSKHSRIHYGRSTYNNRPFTRRYCKQIFRIYQQWHHQHLHHPNNEQHYHRNR